MATILQIPGSLSMAGNIQDIILDSAQTVNFKILLGAEVLLEENYDPDASNRIKIRLRDLLPSLLSLSIPTDNVFEQTAAVKTFTFNIGGVTSNHTVVAGGVDATVDALTFLKANWLTWQLQQKRVKYTDPEWLSYYATEAVAVKLKAYFKVGDAQTITLANFTAGKFYSLNVNFQYLSGLFESQPVYFDIWTEKAGPVRLSFIQRYVLMNDYYDSDDVFVFENSIGGIDTIRFTGEKEENNNFEISSALFDEDTLDYDIDFGRVYKKNTGYFASDRERVWANEFFNSVNRYLVTDEGLKRITVPEATGKFLHGDSASLNYEFNFALSKQTKYLNFARSETLPENVEIIDPDSEVFFLAPRLVEFPIATLNDSLLFPVQSPFSQEWRQLSYDAIRADLQVKLIEQLPQDMSGTRIDVEGDEDTDNVAQIKNTSATGNGMEVDAGSADGYILALKDYLGNLKFLFQANGRLLFPDGYIEQNSKEGVASNGGKMLLNNGTIANFLLKELASGKYSFGNGDAIEALVMNMLTGAIGTDEFASGFSGNGWQIEKVDGKFHITIDELTVRGALNVYELIIRKLNAVNGGLLISVANHKSLSSQLNNGVSYRIFIDEDNGNSPIQFIAGDFIKAQIFTGKGVSSYLGKVTAVNHSNDLGEAYVDALTVSGNPWQVMDLVQCGHESDVSRQNMIYITASDDHNPYIDFLSGVNDGNFAGKSKVRIGNLAGINDPAFGQLSGMGLFGENVFLKGKFEISGGSTGYENFSDKPDLSGLAARNLFLNSASEIVFDRFHEIHVGDILAAYVGKEVVISFELKATIARSLHVYPYQGSGVTIADSIYIDAKTEYTRFILQSTVVSNPVPPEMTEGGIGIYDEAGSQSILIKKIMVAIGNVATNWSPAQGDIDIAISSAQLAANNAQSTADTANTAVGTLNNYVNGAFNDGLVEESEARAIEKYINIINDSKTAAENQYNNLYTNSYLEGTPKTGLLNAKITLFGAIENLLTSVNTAIGDGKTTLAEKADVDAKYALYITSMGSYKAAVEAAGKAIQDKLDNLSTDKVNNIQIADRNLFVDSGKEIVFDRFHEIHIGDILAAYVGEEVVISFELKATIARSLRVYPYQGSGITIADSIYIDATTEYTRFILQSTVVSNPVPPGMTEGGLGIYDVAGSQILCIKEIMVAIGNKAVTWKPRPEETDSFYLKNALQNNTTIQGGLLATALMRLGAVNQNGTWIEKAGLNGIPGDDNTPRLWTGGTLEQAIARVAGDLNGAKTVITEGGKIFGKEVELYGTLATAPTGERIVLDQASKAIIIYDANNVPKTIITSASIPALAVLLASNSAQVDASVLASAAASGDTVVDTKYSASLVLAASASNYTIITPQISCYCLTNNDGFLQYRASSYVFVSLVLPDNSEIELGGISASTSGQNYASVTIPAQQFSGMPAGAYKIKLVASATAASQAEANAEAQIAAPNNILRGESLVNVSRIYRDGMFLITDASHYHYISPTQEIVKNSEVRGFGAIAAAYVASNGNLSSYFNSIISSVDAPGSGLYTINHSIGHTNYCPIVTPVGDGNYSATVFNIGANSFQVRTRNAGTAANLAFYVKISG